MVEAAAKAGVGRDTLSNLERGRSHPVMPTLAKIAKGYGVPVEELLEEPALAEKAEAPLSREWALSTPDEAFRRRVEDAPTEELRGLVIELVAGEHPRLFEDERDEKPTADVLYRRSASFARALIVREELLERGEEPPEKYLLALRRYMNALELSEDPVLGRYKAEKIFPPEQVAAFLAEDESQNEHIRAQAAEMSANEIRELVLAHPPLRRLVEAFAKNAEQRSRDEARERPA